MDNPWLDIRNSAGHLLFRYNPFTNEIELRSKGVVYELIRLDEIRARHGIIAQVEADRGHPETVVIPERRGNGSSQG